ncbi:hypothetical protein M231_01989 [Tremella mesenterica]|uniref:Uncharacterized protein n=1 Tax=Tremella mesenterica TaxID=5217 RepID=A0A4V1M4L0_TREME|nr:hypothetical protein M231_01989 [Tremella mesenterica]
MEQGQYYSYSTTPTNDLYFQNPVLPTWSPSSDQTEVNPSSFPALQASYNEIYPEFPPLTPKHTSTIDPYNQAKEGKVTTWCIPKPLESITDPEKSFSPSLLILDEPNTNTNTTSTLNTPQIPDFSNCGYQSTNFGEFIEPNVSPTFVKMRDETTLGFLARSLGYDENDLGKLLLDSWVSQEKKEALNQLKYRMIGDEEQWKMARTEAERRELKKHINDHAIRRLSRLIDCSEQMILSYLRGKMEDVDLSTTKSLNKFRDDPHKFIQDISSSTPPASILIPLDQCLTAAVSQAAYLEWRAQFGNQLSAKSFYAEPIPDRKRDKPEKPRPKQNHTEITGKSTRLTSGGRRGKTRSSIDSRSKAQKQAEDVFSVKSNVHLRR